jgi:hypothetical protein
MPIHFIDNYPRNNLELSIHHEDGNPLFGEIWLYEQFIKINENKFLENETWYLKHNYNLSSHPASKGKIEGQIDFLLLSTSGILVIEVKGGGVRVDENDCYYSFNRNSEYQTQNPFNQAKEYTHTLRKLIDSRPFVYRCVVMPHEAGFQLKGPQLMGYNDMFFSKRNFLEVQSDFAINKIFFDFISALGHNTRKKNLSELKSGWSKEMIAKEIYNSYPRLAATELSRLRSELFPIQSSYGFNPDRIYQDIILKENYETLRGLRRNGKVLVQGAPGTGKTVLAIKFLAEGLLRQQKGVFFTANRLVRSKLEHIITKEYELPSSNIRFSIFSQEKMKETEHEQLDFLIFDEAQEYFDKGLFELIQTICTRFDDPRILILYDPEQSIVSDFKDLGWYSDFFISSGYTHYHFDEMYRCIQNSEISRLSGLILHGNYTRIRSEFKESICHPISEKEKLKVIGEILDDRKFTNSEKIILVTSNVDGFQELISRFFKNEIEELTESNMNLPSQKMRFTTPIKYRGLESEAVYLITTGIDDHSKVQNYVGVTRAMNLIKIILWS